MRIPIVNEKDEIIAIKDRSEVQHGLDIYRVSALWLTNSKGEILIAQRSLNKKDNPGVWGPAVAGTIEEGETYEGNIYKEAEEEIGLTGLKFEEGPKMLRNGSRRYFLQWYLGSLDRNIEDFKIKDDEVAQLKWVSKKDLKNDMDMNSGMYVLGMPEYVKMFC